MANLLFKEEWFKIISNTDQYDEDRNFIAWAVLKFLATGRENELDETASCYEDKIKELTIEVRKEVEKRRRRAEAARRRREERKQNKQNEINRPRRSRQRIYEAHPAMYLFDGFASFMMSTEYRSERKAIAGKFGRAVDFDKAISKFRKYALENKLLSFMQRFNVFRDMFTRFVNEHPRGLLLHATATIPALS